MSDLKFPNAKPDTGLDEPPVASGKRDAPPRPRIYDQLATVYESAANLRFYQRLAHELADFARTHQSGPLRPARSPQALDLACGTGISTKMFSTELRDYHWTGADASPAMIAQAHHKLRGLSPGERPGLKVAHAEHLPFDDQSIDAVTCSYGMHWMTDAAFTEIDRVLKPRGWLALAIPLARPLEPKNGNRELIALARTIHAANSVHPNRNARREPSPELILSPWSRGMRTVDIEAAMSRWITPQIDARQFDESFSSRDEWWQALYSRGCLAAIFPQGAPAAVPDPQSFSAGAVHFNWSYALAYARKASRPN